MVLNRGVGTVIATDGGIKNILVVVDYITKWPEVFVIPNENRVTVAEKFVKEVFCQFGIPLEFPSTPTKTRTSNLNFLR
ncbi:hypothetical protein EVAR_23602_1 [Eumeta japonica]|uniref:Integrase catalytic domain-containing protein n=1 Tax=Eumeta variegata TaxID=151549 RepID=A0A4C1WZ09_EUMVA|nr:hypothetical protein EVAR_23602_1 [Eumeta japonica]